MKTFLWTVGLIIVIDICFVAFFHFASLPLRKRRRKAKAEYYETEIFDCPRCRGRGFWQEAERPPLAMIDLSATTVSVDAPGMSIKINTITCKLCEGTGRQAIRRKIHAA